MTGFSSLDIRVEFLDARVLKSHDYHDDDDLDNCFAAVPQHELHPLILLLLLVLSIGSC